MEILSECFGHGHLGNSNETPPSHIRVDRIADIDMFSISKPNDFLMFFHQFLKGL